MNGPLVVTGGGRGIGAATARLAAERRFKVVICFLNDEAAAQSLVDSIVQSGGEAIAVRADVRKEGDVERLFAKVDAVFGPLAVLVNNAGIVAPRSDLAAMTAARIESVLATNVLGSLLCAREAVRRMSRSQGGAGGCIVNVSSAASRHGSAGEYVDYAASKAAIDTFTVGLAREVAAEGIRVNAVRPGIIGTEIHASGGDPTRVARLRSSLPMQREGSAQEVAEAILWLASAAASYCTGSILDVAGGR